MYMDGNSDRGNNIRIDAFNANITAHDWVNIASTNGRVAIDGQSVHLYPTYQHYISRC